MGSCEVMGSLASWHGWPTGTPPPISTTVVGGCVKRLRSALWGTAPVLALSPHCVWSVLFCFHNAWVSHTGSHVLYCGRCQGLVITMLHDAQLRSFQMVAATGSLIHPSAQCSLHFTSCSFTFSAVVFPLGRLGRKPMGELMAEGKRLGLCGVSSERVAREGRRRMYLNPRSSLERCSSVQW